MDMNEEKGRVTGIGGIFFKAANPDETKEWYRTNLGLNTDKWGTNFVWRQAQDPSKHGYSQWSVMKDSTDYLGDPNQQFMVNYRVDDMDAILSKLMSAGVELVGEVEIEKYGKFAHIRDLDGQRIQLWEPNDEEYEKCLEGVTS